MKIYLVGGAVRDQLLHRPVTEHDYVVVGATPQAMLDQGFRQVGKDFPVFLHPKTQEEYALARTERKSGFGYHGFTVYASPDVTLEADLERRDLTINAMAQDDSGQIIDPFHGQHDLHDRYLRHVSPAFSEDPVRILRLARFAARYHELGFRVHPDTMQLMLAMVRDGEVHHLVAERVWQEMQKALQEPHPEIFFEVLRMCGACAVLFPELDALYGVPNPPKWHPEIDSGVHTMMVLQCAVLLSADPKIRFAALAHDFGKALTPMDIWPHHYGHDKKGVVPIETFCERLKIPVEYRDLAMLASRYHILIHQCRELRPSTLLEILHGLDAIRRPDRFREVLLVCEADHQGRAGNESTQYPQSDYMTGAYDACMKVDVAAIVSSVKGGEAIKKALHDARVIAIQEWQMTGS